VGLAQFKGGSTKMYKELRKKGGERFEKKDRRDLDFRKCPTRGLQKKGEGNRGSNITEYVGPFGKKKQEFRSLEKKTALRRKITECH